MDVALSTAPHSKHGIHLGRLRLRERVPSRPCSDVGQSRPRPALQTPTPLGRRMANGDV